MLQQAKSTFLTLGGGELSFDGSHHLGFRDGLRVRTTALPLIFPVSQIPGLSTSLLLDTN